MITPDPRKNIFGDHIGGATGDWNQSPFASYRFQFNVLGWQTIDQNFPQSIQGFSTSGGGSQVNSLTFGNISTGLFSNGLGYDGAPWGPHGAIRIEEPGLYYASAAISVRMQVAGVALLLISWNESGWKLRVEILRVMRHHVRYRPLNTMDQAMLSLHGSTCL
jgi:hypothetical protein